MHIEHLGSREGILQAKLEIFRGVPKNGVGIFNGDEPLLWNVRADGGHKKYYYGIENHACDVIATDIQELEDGMRFVVSGFGHRFELFVPVLGRHTVYNALAAVTAALLHEGPARDDPGADLQLPQYRHAPEDLRARRLHHHRGLL